MLNNLKNNLLTKYKEFEQTIEKELHASSKSDGSFPNLNNSPTVVDRIVNIPVESIESKNIGERSTVEDTQILAASIDTLVNLNSNAEVQKVDVVRNGDPSTIKLNETIRELRYSLSMKSKELERVTALLMESKAENQHLKDSSGDHLKGLESLLHESQKNQESLAFKEEKLQNLNNQILKLQSENQTLTSQLQESDIEIIHLKRTVELVKTQHSQDKQDYEVKIISLRQEVLNSQQGYETYKKKVSLILSDKQDDILKKRIDDLEICLEKAELEKIKSTKTIEVYLGRVRQLENTLESLSRQVKESEKLSELTDSYQNEVVQLKASVRELNRLREFEKLEAQAELTTVKESLLLERSEFEKNMNIMIQNLKLVIQKREEEISSLEKRSVDLLHALEKYQHDNERRQSVDEPEDHKNSSRPSSQTTSFRSKPSTHEIYERRILELTELLQESETNMNFYQQQLKILKEELRRADRDKKRQDHGLNHQYLKNVMLSFMEHPSESLIPILCELLNLDDNDARRLRKLLVNIGDQSTGFWSF